MTKTISLIPGDGIGPEISEAVVQILLAAGCAVAWEKCEAGESALKAGHETMLPLKTIESIKKNKVALKGPLVTPVGLGDRSANVMLRKLFNTYANIRPIKTMPGVATPFSDQNLDFWIVRENVEDVYAGIEYEAPNGVATALKIMSPQGCEDIVRFAFELAKTEGRRSVHCATKANILKKTEGLMKRTFERVALEYPQISAQHIIIDNCAHQLVRTPSQFEVLVMSNLHGDIISDLASGLVGGLGVAPGANIGEDMAIFEAVHGAAPDIAGQNKANPTALLQSAIMMLRYLNMLEKAEMIENALFLTLQEGKALTQDLAPPSKGASTEVFTAEVIKNLEKKTTGRSSPKFMPLPNPSLKPAPQIELSYKKKVHFYIHWRGSVEALAHKLEAISEKNNCTLESISSRGAQVYPSLGAVPVDIPPFQCIININNGYTLLQFMKMLEKEDLTPISYWLNF